MAAPTHRTRQRLVMAAALVVGLCALGLTLIRAYRAPITSLLPGGMLRVGVDASYPPFAAFDGTRYFGIDVALAEALAAELGVMPAFVNLGFDGLYDALLTDRVDVLISSLIPDPARTNRIHYSPAYFNAGLVLVSPTHAPIAAAALADQRIAFAYGSDAHTFVLRWERHETGLQTRPYELPRYALDAVRLGHADAALVNALDWLAYPEADGALSAEAVTVVPYVVAIRSERADLAGWIDDALRSLLTSGQIDALIAVGFG